MILQRILNECVWTPYGVTCPDANIAMVMHKFLREAILDRHLYLCKAIGFEIKSSSKIRNTTNTYIARHIQVGESYPEIMVNLQDKLFLCTESTLIKSEIHAGMNTVDNVQFFIDKGKIVPCLSTQPMLCNVLQNTCHFEIKVLYDCGYRTNAQNSAVLDSNYFPCSTDFYAGDFFRVLPPIFGTANIRINYYHGTSPDVLRFLLSCWLTAIEESSIRKEELKWLRSFEQ